MDWFPWGEEAFARARDEDKPVFLSVGYSSCHWCHVMEHESFEDEGIASLLNGGFISIKVDREERPDVDEAYMTAVQLSSGRGGWPMSVFLTPDRKPFFAGTYFPREDRGKVAGFASILTQISNVWRTRREEVLQSAESYAAALSQSLGGPTSGTFVTLSQNLIDDCVRTLASDFDQKHGGFGGAPKFPPHAAIEFLLNYAVSEKANQDLRQAALAMACFTLEQMALGGIHDHVGGGFHRYSTDDRWLLPHFEKMLYDNALLLRNYSLAAGLVSEVDPRLTNLYAWTAHGIAEWVTREMTSPEGLFYSALDADSEGEEGKYYVWKTDEVRTYVPSADAFLSSYGFKEQGNFHDEATGTNTGANIPHLSQDEQGAYAAVLETLREAREERVRPGLDDKALVGWNGLMIGALAEAGSIDLSLKAAKAILSAEHAYGRLPHQIAKGVISGEAYLDDFAYLIDGILRLSSFLGFLEEQREGAGKEASSFWQNEAMRLANEMVRLFWDEEGGGFFSTSPRHEFLFGRTKPVLDQPIPSGNAIAIHVLTELGQTDRAMKGLEALAGWMQRAPQATEALHLAAMSVPFEDSHPPVPAPLKDVVVFFTPKETRVGPNGSAEFEVRISIPDGLHLNSPNPPTRWLTPTKVEVNGVQADVRYPEAHGDRYRGEVVVPLKLWLKDGEEGAEFEAMVTWQACTESECRLPQEKVFSGVIYR